MCREAGVELLYHLLFVKAGVGPKELDSAALVSALKADGVYFPEMSRR